MGTVGVLVYCPSCGSEIVVDSRFCSACGAATEAEATKAKLPDEPADAVRIKKDVSTYQPPCIDEVLANDDGGRSLFRVRLAGGAAAALILVIVGAALLSGRRPATSTTGTSGSIPVSQVGDESKADDGGRDGPGQESPAAAAATSELNRETAGELLDSRFEKALPGEFPAPCKIGLLYKDKLRAEDAAMHIQALSRADLLDTARLIPAIGTTLVEFVPSQTGAAVMSAASGFGNVGWVAFCEGAEVVEVTGIRKDEGTGTTIVEYVWMPFTNQDLVSLFAPYVQQGLDGLEDVRCSDVAPFAQYDDGWRLMNDEFYIGCQLFNPVEFGAVTTTAPVTELDVSAAAETDLDLRDADLRGKDFTEENLDGLDLSGANLEGATFDGASLIGANLDGANLDGAVFDRADLSDASLRRTRKITNASFKNAILTGADLSGLYLGANERRGSEMLQGADIRNTILMGSTLQYFGGMDLSGANLSDASIRFAPSAVFEGADLQRSELERDLTEAVFRDADLAGATIAGTYVGANFSGASLRGTRFRIVDMSGADLSNADLTGAVWLDPVTWGDTVCPDGTNSDLEDGDGFSCVANMPEEPATFLPLLYDAISGGDVSFLVGRLHASVIARYGLEACTQSMRTLVDPEWAFGNSWRNGSFYDTWDLDGTTVADVYRLSYWMQKPDTRWDGEMSLAVVEGTLRWFYTCE